MALRLGRYFWKLFLANAAVMALVLTVSVWVIIVQFDRFYQAELSDHLAAQAAALDIIAHDIFDVDHARDLEELANQFSSRELNLVRVTLVL